MSHSAALSQREMGTGKSQRQEGVQPMTSSCGRFGASWLSVCLFNGPMDELFPCVHCFRMFLRLYISFDPLMCFYYPQVSSPAGWLGTPALHPRCLRRSSGSLWRKPKTTRKTIRIGKTWKNHYQHCTSIPL